MNLRLYKTLLVACLGIILVACDKNEVVPSYSTVGKTTSTEASMSVSSSSPLAGTEITFTMKYVNLSSDPAKSVVLMAKIGTADFVPLETFNEESAAKDKQIVHEVKYTPAAAGAIVFDMVVTSQAEFPLTRRVNVSVK